MKLVRSEFFEELDENSEQYLIEMASTKDFKLSIGTVQALVRPRERGVIPHFHIHIMSDNSYNNDITIRLDKPEYFIHGNHTGMLNSKDRKKLANFMKEVYARSTTNWEYLVLKWENDHPDILIDMEECPNYRLLPDKK